MREDGTLSQQDHVDVELVFAQVNTLQKDVAQDQPPIPLGSDDPFDFLPVIVHGGASYIPELQESHFF